MSKEEKQLLLKDLCARLPYGVKVNISASRPDRYDNFVKSINDATINSIDLNIEKCRFKEFWWDTYIVNVRPYLRPMSSMTEEEKKEFIHCVEYEVEESVNGRHYEYCLKDYVGTPEKPICNHNATDWLNKNMFDYRDLIPMGLALPALEGMYKNE